MPFQNFIPRGFEPSRVVITGIGLVTPLGVGASQSWESLLSGASGTRPLQPQHLPPGHADAAAQLKCNVVAPVDEAAFQAACATPMGSSKAAGGGAGACKQRLLGVQARQQSRYIEFARLAASEALKHAQYDPVKGAAPDHVGVCVGSGMAGVAQLAEAAGHVLAGQPRKVSPFFVPSVLNNMSAGAIGIDRGFRGPTSAPSTACATGLHALGDAFHTLRRRDAPVMLAGASEACLDAVSLAGFARMRALSTRHGGAPAAASRPFDRTRDGFVMGEGAGILVLETLEHATARLAPIIAEVRGFGTSADAHHVSSPPADGAGAALAMARALRAAGAEPADVAYINAHATSTPLGDAAELAAIQTVFGSDRPRTGDLLVSSTKGATGHLLGAAGAVEAAFTALAARNRNAPPTTNLHDPDDAAAGLEGLLKHGEARALASRALCMCNSFGFGGVNASLLLAAVEGPVSWGHYI